MRNAAEEERATETNRLQERRARARTNILRSATRCSTSSEGILGSSNYDLSRLRGLDAPTALATSHRATIATWTRNNERILNYVEKLSAVTARADLLAAFEGLTR